ncbi:MAG: hypothetical protein ACKVP5_23150 [Aestuariivirga sp.]
MNTALKLFAKKCGAPVALAVFIMLGGPAFALFNVFPDGLPSVVQAVNLTVVWKNELTPAVNVDIAASTQFN